MILTDNMILFFHCGENANSCGKMLVSILKWIQDISHSKRKNMEIVKSEENWFTRWKFGMYKTRHM